MTKHRKKSIPWLICIGILTLFSCSEEIYNEAVVQNSVPDKVARMVINVNEVTAELENPEIKDFTIKNFKNKYSPDPAQRTEQSDDSTYIYFDKFVKNGEYTIYSFKVNEYLKNDPYELTYIIQKDLRSGEERAGFVKLTPGTGETHLILTDFTGTVEVLDINKVTVAIDTFSAGTKIMSDEASRGIGCTDHLDFIVHECTAGGHHTPDDGEECESNDAYWEVAVHTICTYVGGSIGSPSHAAGTPPSGGGSSTVPPKAKDVIKCLTKEMLSSIFPNASDDTKTKLLANIKSFAKYYNIDTKEELCHFLAQAGTETGGFLRLNATENMNYTTAARLRAVYPRKFALNHATKPNGDIYLNNPELLANYVYCCQNGNGDINSGDGWLYRGRGIIQLTGKGNYDKFKIYMESIGFGWWYNNDPNNVANADGTMAIISGMWYFKTRVLDKITINEATTVEKVTSRINPGLAKLQARKDYYTSAKNSIINCK